MNADMTMSFSRKDFIGMGAMAALAGCAGLHGARSGRFAMNASTLRGYNLTLLDQMKAMALSGFRGYVWDGWAKSPSRDKSPGHFLCQNAFLHSGSPPVPGVLQGIFPL